MQTRRPHRDHERAGSGYKLCGRIVPAPGGALIKNPDGEVLGAIGISSDISDTDETCPVAGIEAVGLKAQTGLT